MYNNYIKRILDITICILALPFFLVFLLVVGCLIKLEDRGPIFYNAKRIGKNSELFDMYKFRSMKVGAQLILNEDGSTYNSGEDNRVTKIGKFIRETSIDEIPQILNVLRGDMSIIGPRASLAKAIGSYKEDEIDKLKVRPGITGFTQAYFRNGLSNRDKRLKDAWYANNITILLDMKILFRTIFVVIKQENLYTNMKGNVGSRNDREAKA